MSRINSYRLQSKFLLRVKNFFVLIVTYIVAGLLEFLLRKSVFTNLLLFGLISS